MDAHAFKPEPPAVDVRNVLAEQHSPWRFAEKHGTFRPPSPAP